MLRAILNKSWRQHLTKQHLYGHLPPIIKTIKIRQTRHAGHRDELMSDVLQWTPSQGRAKAGRPAWTYVQQLGADTGCSSEDLPKAMDDRDVWQERVRNIRADSATWWRSWYIYIYIYIYRERERERVREIIYIYIYIYIEREREREKERERERVREMIYIYIYIYIYNIYIIQTIYKIKLWGIPIPYHFCLVWYGWILWHINPCWLFYTKSIFIYTYRIWFVNTFRW